MNSDQMKDALMVWYHGILEDNFEEADKFNEVMASWEVVVDGMTYDEKEFMCLQLGMDF